jgi:hypothetical protein
MPQIAQLKIKVSSWSAKLLLFSQISQKAKNENFVGKIRPLYKNKANYGKGCLDRLI